MQRRLTPLMYVGLCLFALAVPDARGEEAQAPAAPATPSAKVLRIGLIGLDTSHTTAFTALLNDPSNPDHVPGARVVAAFRGGSPDVEASATRIDKFTAELRDRWKVEIVDSIEGLLTKVDAVMLTSVDGRVHLAQARPVLAARKPLFVDKPMAASTKDAAELVRLAKASGTPLFSASSRRFADDVLALQADPRAGSVIGASTFGPATLEPHHPDLFWYGVHAVETLFQLMGTGCVSVTRTHTEGTDVVVGTWADGRVGVMRGVRHGASTTYGHTIHGTKAVISTTSDTPPSAGTKPRAGYYGLLARAIEFFRTGKAPVSPEETLETLAFMEAADLSKARNGASVRLSEVLPTR